MSTTPETDEFRRVHMRKPVFLLHPNNACKDCLVKRRRLSAIGIPIHQVASFGFAPWRWRGAVALWSRVTPRQRIPGRRCLCGGSATMAMSAVSHAGVLIAFHRVEPVVTDGASAV